jgi:glycosyltransferase involved in cell wall biosynthesis
MRELSWQAMTRKYPAPYVVAGWLPPEDAAAGLGKLRRSLLERLARALPLSGDYAMAEIIERDGTYIQCGLASANDAAELAEAVSAIDTGSRSAWARHWRFRFDEAAAIAIEGALGRPGLGKTLPQAAENPG